MSFSHIHVQGFICSKPSKHVKRRPTYGEMMKDVKGNYHCGPAVFGRIIITDPLRHQRGTDRKNESRTIKKKQGQ